MNAYPTALNYFNAKIEDFLSQLRSDRALQLRARMSDSIRLSYLTISWSDSSSASQERCDLFYYSGYDALFLYMEKQGNISAWLLRRTTTGFSIREMHAADDPESGARAFLFEKSNDEVAEVEGQFLLMEEISMLHKEKTGHFGYDEPFKLEQRQTFGLIRDKISYMDRRIRELRVQNSEGGNPSSSERR